MEAAPLETNRLVTASLSADAQHNPAPKLRLSCTHGLKFILNQFISSFHYCHISTCVGANLFRPVFACTSVRACVLCVSAFIFVCLYLCLRLCVIFQFSFALHGGFVVPGEKPMPENAQKRVQES